MQRLTAPVAGVLEAPAIDVDELADKISAKLKKQETHTQPEPKKTGWAEYFTRR